MSFASDVKEELARQILDDNCARGRLSAILQLLSSLSLSSQGLKLDIRCNSAVISKTIVADIRQIYNLKCQINVISSASNSRKKSYQIILEDNARDVLTDLDLWTDKGLQSHPRMSFLSSEEMVKAYIAGCFLACGSVNSPATSDYHLEFRANDESHASFLVRLLAKFYITAKITQRRGKSIVYIKSSQQIADTLSLMEAYDNLFEYEDVRMQRDFVNSNRRLNNTEIANEMKIQATAEKQYEAARFLKDNDLINLLNEKDRDIALLRLKYDDASLNELSQFYENTFGIQISKSGIRHRFDKIIALADKYRGVIGDEK